MRKCILGSVFTFAFVLGSAIVALGSQPQPENKPQPKAFDAYASSPFTLDNVLIYDNIEITSVKKDARIVLYSGPEVDESTVITSSSQGYINYNVPVSGRYTLTCTDTWGGGWYSY